MKKILSLAISATLSIASTAVIADNTEKKYVGIQHTFETKEHSRAELFRVGKYFNDSFALEGRIGFESNSVEIDPTHTFESNSLLGVYGVRHLQISETSSVYSMIGASVVDVEVKEYDQTRYVCPSSGCTGTRTEDRKVISSVYESGVGISFGVGANIGLTDNAALNIEYIQYLNQSEFVYDTVGFGLKYIF